MERDPIKRRLPAAFRTLHYWEEELQRIADRSMHHENAVIPRESAQRIGEAILDIGEAGGDSERVRQLYQSATHFVTAKGRTKRESYEGVTCDNLLSVVRSALHVFADLDPSADPSRDQPQN